LAKTLNILKRQIAAMFTGLLETMTKALSFEKFWAGYAPGARGKGMSYSEFLKVSAIVGVHSGILQGAEF